MEEWDVYDASRNLTGRTVRRGMDKLQPGEYHLVVDVWLLDENNRILIQKRSCRKKNFPGKWAQSAGGAVIKGEDSFQGCIRETEEELGIVPDMQKAELATSFIRHGDTIVDVYVIRQDSLPDKFVLPADEVEDIRWADVNEIENLLQQGQFVPTVMEGLQAALQNNVTFPPEEDVIFD